MNVTLPNPFTVVITGLRAAWLPASEWEAALTAMGEQLQGDIANGFAGQRTGGTKQLKTNSPTYNAWKARKGFDTRRGHKTNTLQSMLRPQASQLFIVRGPNKAGYATITFLEKRLYSVVPYAEYYEEAKVRGAGILELTKAWVQRASAIIAAADLKARINEQVELASRKVKAAMRQQQLLPTFKLSKRDAAALSKQARALARQEGVLTSHKARGRLGGILSGLARRK